MLSMTTAHDPLDLRLLAHFLVVIDTGTISGAATRLNLTQSGLSRQIQQLEKHTGVQLFARTASRLEPTAGGQHLAVLARELLDRSDDTRDAVRQMASGKAPRLRVVCPEATVRGVIAPFVAATAAPIHDTVIDVAAHVYEHLDRREADLAINPLRPPLGLSSRLLGTVAVRAYATAGHELMGRDVVTPRDLVAHPLVILARTSGLRHVIDEALWEVRDRVRLAAEPVSSELAMALAAAGAGVCLDLGDAPFGLEARPFVTAAGVPVRMPLYAAWDREHYAAADILALVGRLGDWGRSGQWDDA